MTPRVAPADTDPQESNGGVARSHNAAGGKATGTVDHHTGNAFRESSPATRRRPSTERTVLNDGHVAVF